MSLILSGTDGLSDVDGSAATPAIRGTDANTGIFFPAADTIAFSEGGAEAMRIDSSGNVGIGTSAPNAANKLEVTGDITTSWSSAVTRFIGSRFTDGTGYELGIKTVLDTRETRVIAKAADTGGFVTIATGSAPTERMRIDSSGNVGIGTSSPSVKLDVAATTAVVQMDSSGGAAGAAVTRYKASNRTWVTGVNATDATGAYTVYDVTASAERMRIDSSGNLCLGRSSVGVGDRFVVQTTASGTIMLGYNSSATNTFQILDSGNVRNTNNSYGAISDAKMKENVVDATSKLEKLNQVRVVNFNLIGDEQKQIGVIAQELEQIFPSMVEESNDRDVEGNDLGTTTKSVKYSVFVPMLIKAIQEQQALIQSLTTRITALETPVPTGTQA